MKPTILVLFASAMFAGCATDTAVRTDDAVLAQRIQHTWVTAPDDLVVDGETTFLPGGVMNIFGHFKHGGKIHTVVGSGRWHIKDGYLHYTIYESNIPRILPDGFTSVDRIVRITDSQFTYISSADGKTTTERRLR